MKYDRTVLSSEKRWKTFFSVRHTSKEIEYRVREDGNVLRRGLFFVILDS